MTHPLHTFSPRPARSFRSTRGFSLIELMISLTIGLVIVIAAMAAYLGSSGASRVSEAQGRMNEDAQAALSILAQQIRLAGTNPMQPQRADDYQQNPVYSSTYVGGTAMAYTTTMPTVSPTTYTSSGFAIRGCDGIFTNILTATRTDSLTCPTGTPTTADSIAISYEADKYNTVPTSSNTPTDCLGNSIPTTVNATFTIGTSTTATFWVADNRYFITPTSSIPTLHCKGNGNTNSYPLVENVEDMQLSYGTVSITNTYTTATIAGYLNASDFTGIAPQPGDTAAGWGKVQTVRVCVVVRSEAPVAPDTISSRYIKCDGTVDTSQTDLRLRRAYTTTVVLRNRKL